MMPLTSVFLTSLLCLFNILTFLGFMTTIILFHTRYSYLASAGVGPYEASFADPSLFLPTVAAINVATLYSVALRDPTVSFTLTPITCSGQDCSSHFFPGGMRLVYPLPSLFTNYSNVDTGIVHQSQGIQIDLWDVGPSDTFSGYCKTWGNDYLAMQLCVANSATIPDALIAGFCPIEFY
jgi:hypothetical protein